jgi:hypothetical protein
MYAQIIETLICNMRNVNIDDFIQTNKYENSDVTQN